MGAIGTTLYLGTETCFEEPGCAQSYQLTGTLENLPFHDVPLQLGVEGRSGII